MDLLARFVDIMMVFVIYMAIGVEGVAYDAACTGPGVGDCTDNNNICDGTSNKCACSTTSYRKGGTECATKIALTGACTASPTGQCADANSECHATDLICVCKSSYFADKNAACALRVTALDGTCDATDSASDQCVIADSECRIDGAGGKCLCKATHYTAGAACAIRKKPDEACTADQCVTHATCDTTDTNKCVCDADYNPLPTISPTMCSGVVKVTILPYMYVVPILVSMMFLLR